MVNFLFIPSKIVDSIFCGLTVISSKKPRRQRQQKRRLKIYKFSLLVLLQENGAFCFAREFIIDFGRRGVGTEFFILICPKLSHAHTDVTSRIRHTTHV